MKGIIANWCIKLLVGPWPYLAHTFRGYVITSGRWHSVWHSFGWSIVVCFHGMLGQHHYSISLISRMWSSTHNIETLQCIASSKIILHFFPDSEEASKFPTICEFAFRQILMIFHLRRIQGAKGAVAPPPASKKLFADTPSQASRETGRKSWNSVPGNKTKRVSMSSVKIPSCNSMLSLYNVAIEWRKFAVLCRPKPLYRLAPGKKIVDTSLNSITFLLLFCPV